MSSLSEPERQVVERALGMSGGYVLDFTDQTFSAFFDKHGVNIDNAVFHQGGSSKAKRMRTFWKLSPDRTVGAVLKELIDTARIKTELGDLQVSEKVLVKCDDAVCRLLGTKPATGSDEREFLAAQFPFTSVAKLPIEPTLIPIVERRLNEARLTLESGAFLSTVVLCGSLLEAALLGAAIANPKKFVSARAAPKKDGKVKSFPHWKLAELLDVAEQVKEIAPDVNRFGHAMREFRNYIHPHEELRAKFTPDEHTARLCLQALMAAFSGLAGER